MLKYKFDLRHILTETKELHVYRNDVIMKRKSKLSAFVPHRIFDIKFKYGLRYLFSKTTKSPVTELSNKSLRKLAFVASNTSIEFGVMITLTYPNIFPTNGASVKYHLKKFIKAMVERFDCSYLWFLEFQQRGAPHFHILISNKSYENPKDVDWVGERWYEIVNSGDIKHRHAGTRIEGVRNKGNLRHYAVKYAMKPKQKVVPKNYRNVGRFWGHSKDVKPIINRIIETSCDKDALGKIEDSWLYKNSVKGKIVSVLYNASSHIMDEH